MVVEVFVFPLIFPTDSDNWWVDRDVEKIVGSDLFICTASGAYEIFKNAERIMSCKGIDCKIVGESSLLVINRINKAKPLPFVKTH